MIRLLWLVLGLIVGYTARRPVCERDHRLPRHLDPAIVNREDDAGIQPPDPRTWTGNTTLPTWTATTAPPVTATWPDMLRHGDHAPGVWSPGCQRCGADRWVRGARA